VYILIASSEPEVEQPKMPSFAENAKFAEDADANLPRM